MNIKFPNIFDYISISEENTNFFLNDYIEFKKSNFKIESKDAVNLALILNLKKQQTNNEIRDIDFSFVDFSGCDLRGQRFFNCNFEKSRFIKSYLDEIEFYDCNIEGAIFDNSFMECACFDNCILKKTSFNNCHLLASQFFDCDLSSSSFLGTNLMEAEGTNLNVTNLKIDNNTSINFSEFQQVDWSTTDVSMLNISTDQMKYFFDCVKGIKTMQIFNDDYQTPKFRIKEDLLFNELIKHSNDIVESDGEIQLNENIAFISFASEKKESTVMPLKKILEKEFQVWIDEKLVPEEKLKGQIENIIKKCKLAVVVLSKEYLIKGWTRYEFTRLYNELKSRNLNIIVFIKNKNLKYAFNDFLNTLDESEEKLSFNIISSRKELVSYLKINGK